VGFVIFIHVAVSNAILAEDRGHRLQCNAALIITFSYSPKFLSRSTIAFSKPAHSLTPCALQQQATRVGIADSD
jgi:hypothetical protein